MMFGLDLYNKFLNAGVKAVQGTIKLASHVEANLSKRVGSGGGVVTVRMPVSRRKVKLTLAGGVYKQVLLHGALGYEPTTLSLWLQMCKHADIALDIGGHVGLFSLLAADSNPSIFIHTFEPHPENFAVLQRNVQAFGSRCKVISHQIALSDKEGVMPMILRGSSGSTLSQDFWQDSELLPQIEVATSTLDSWLQDNHIELTERSLIKMDVETHEPAVLRGAKKSLEQAPAIVCEVLATFTERELNELLPPERWRYFWLGPDGPAERRNIVGDPSWKWANYLFLTKDSPYLSIIQKQ